MAKKPSENRITKKVEDFIRYIFSDYRKRSSWQRRKGEDQITVQKSKDPFANISVHVGRMILNVTLETRREKKNKEFDGKKFVIFLRVGNEGSLLSFQHEIQSLVLFELS
ncbi:hypothetical protein MFUM_40016 [Methylacidiphilum fumariolicum SolV]|uniref:Uncharacterized protein n=2 Tax=Candidatus Methylacidiphilum fumarolicum TaxID=591154 RepID=I0JY58_METFB|nr:conserved protein of unknown function [Candidatus Methylacidiphilum fumarolicum]CCG92177.1 hypothetical protein MFUM_40016 [Methylacidiphilum fumariolicum SolV]